jgi:hypothetical protein
MLAVGFVLITIPSRILARQHITQNLLCFRSLPQANVKRSTRHNSRHTAHVISAIEIELLNILTINKINFYLYNTNNRLTASVVQWSEFLATHPEVPGSIPGATRFSEKQWVWNGSTQPREHN